MPIIQSGKEVYTFSDAVEATLDAFDVDRTPLAERRARAAVLQAYRDLPSRHKFTYLTRRQLLHTVAAYDTGTVAYDHTGGTYERQLTLTTGTWPSWAAYGYVIIDSVHYEVEDRKSSTVITLSEFSNPGDDVSAGETYTIYRNSYPLPSNFKEALNYGLWDIDQEYALPFVTPGVQNQGLRTTLSTPGTPEEVSIRATGKYQGGRELVFSPPPDTALTYDLLYEAAPRPLSIDEFSQMTVSVTGGSTTVTAASGVVFPLNCVGSIIRFSSNTNKPTSLVGGIQSGDNPFIAQAVIKERTSAEALVVSEAPLSTTLTSVGYTISDPVDIDVNVMYTAFLRMAEAEFARLQSRADWRDKLAVARQEIMYAMEADRVVSNDKGSVPIYDRFRNTRVEEG